MLVAKLDVLGEIDRRGAVRYDSDSPSTLRLEEDEPIDVVVEDFSRKGFRFAADREFPVGTVVSIGLSGAGVRAAKIVRRDGTRHGCMFFKPLSPEQMATAFTGSEAVAADPERRIRRPAARQVPPGERLVVRMREWLEGLFRL